MISRLRAEAAARASDAWFAADAPGGQPCKLPVMGGGPATFRQRDVTAACRAVMAAGLTVAGVEVDLSDRIVVHTVGGGLAPPGSVAAPNPWDVVLRPLQVEPGE